MHGDSPCTMRTSRLSAGVGLITLAFYAAAVVSEPIVDDQTTQYNKPICTKPNTEFRENCKVQATCDNPDESPQLAEKCMEGCFCKDGYVLNPLGRCIVPAECPGVECPGNQTYSNCASGCNKNCQTQYLTEFSSCRCKPGCKCAEGFIDDLKGNCIRSEDCDPEVVRCPANKVYRRCESPVRTCNGLIVHKKCQAGCFCTDGMVLNDRNECVFKEDCPVQEIKERECPANQTFQACPFCGRSCENQYSSIMFKCLCEARCGCNAGYIWKNRNEQECVKPEDCTKEDTKCEEDTQYYSESEVRKTCLRPRGNGVETSGCFCKDGLVYDEERRICMKPENCPNAQCGPGQSYYQCYQNTIRTCQDKKVAKVRDVEDMECKTGCFCSGSNIWDEDSQRCLQPSECENSRENNICRKDDPRSEFRVCQSSTKPTCSNPNPQFTTDDCRDGCRCKEGFVFNEQTEKCMTLAECTIIEPPRSRTCSSNTTYSSCASACPKTCRNAYIPHGPIAHCMACYEGCECKPGYLQTNTKRCVLLKDCPAEDIICPQDRQYKSCEHGIKTCSLGNITMADTCLRGCFCADELVQDDSGRCIYPSECGRAFIDQLWTRRPR